MDPSLPALRARVLAEDGTPVIRPVLGLTAYLDNPELWAREGAKAAWERFSSLPQAQAVEWFTTSVMPTWEPWAMRREARAAEALSSWSWVSDRPRHLLQVTFADSPEVPSVGFAYQEVDPERTRRAAVLELTFPVEMEPAELEAVVRSVLLLGPVHALVAGYTVRWNAFHRRLAFNQAYLWCKRFLGLDVQDPEFSSWWVPAAAPGMGWLTALGPRLAGRIPPAALERLTAARADRVGDALLLRTSAAPSVGDRNALADLAGWQEVAALVSPLLPEAPDGYAGAFAAPDELRAWMLRFVEPERWIG